MQIEFKMYILHEYIYIFLSQILHLDKPLSFYFGQINC